MCRSSSPSDSPTNKTALLTLFFCMSYPPNGCQAISETVFMCMHKAPVGSDIHLARELRQVQ
jgi:hypothetical protein